MKIVFFGLSISSAWGNGHATLLRGLFRSLYALGHAIHFFERDVPYYATHRDSESFPFVQLHLYSDWTAALGAIANQLNTADVAIVTSYCPDGAAASGLVLHSAVPRKVFYDMDTPVTLERAARGEAVPYLPKEGLGGFDLVLSYTGGKSLTGLREQFAARNVAALYGWVDPLIYHRVESSPRFRADLSYLGTYSTDRQPALEQLLLEPARQRPSSAFAVGGAMYPAVDTWPPNVKHYDHVSPNDHRAFYCSSPLTLNITRASFAATGYCPSGRLFESAACGTAVISDWWEGLDTFFQPGGEILIAASSADVLRALSKDRGEVTRMGERARARTLDCHTAAIRARRLLELIEDPRDEAGTSEHSACLLKGVS